MELTLTAVFEELPEAEGGGYAAYVEELPGAISEGDTLDEARANLKDAIRELVEANKALHAAPIAQHKVIREKISVLAS